MKDKVSAAALSAIALFNALCVYLVFKSGMREVYMENGLVENAQAVLLVISGVAFLVALARARGGHRFVLLGFILLCVSFLLRELDVEKFDLPRVLIHVGSGVGRNVIVSLAWAALALYMVRHFRLCMEMLRYWLLSKTGAFLLAGGVLLLLGAMFDRGLASSGYGRFYEEMLELNGYGAILLGALFSRARLRKSGEW
ncbi:MAG: hypothetical protein C0617_04560 [Desulfuromonas sp.]|nr:MAG: hypothetical protein C0617_04560 [Desulfuromonas sp.]